MVSMEKKKRAAVITLVVIAAIIVAAVVTVRLLLTREKLLAIVLPKVEKTIDAKVTIGDIGIRFPFGFGVDITNLSFEKTLPDSSTVSFASAGVTVRASLMSLIRRAPEITAADVRKGTVAMRSPKKGIDLKLRGLESHFSMKPAGSEFAIKAKASVDSVLVAPIGGPTAVAVAAITIEGDMTSDRELTKLKINDAKLGWENLVQATIKGEITDLKTNPRVALTIDAAEKPVAPIIERARAFKLEALSPAKRDAAQAPKTPLEITAGPAGFHASVEGLVKEPPSMNLSFEVSVKNLAFKAGELGSVGKLDADVKGQGGALAWTGLFPSPTKPMTPAQIAAAWKAVKLEGKITLSDASFALQAPAAAPASGQPDPSPAAPLRVSAIKAVAEIANGDVKSVSGEFSIGSSPYTFNASLLNIMPASAELASIAQALAKKGPAEPVADLGPFLDKMVNVPAVTVELKGRSLDARPYEKPLFPKKESGAAPTTPAAVPAGQPPSGGPGAILFLKNATFSAAIDSIITREAIITRLDARGTARDGRIKIDPVTFAYAGGMGKAVVTSDVRKPAHIETKIDFSMDSIQAGQALSGVSSAGSFVEGRFSVKSNAQLVTGPNVDPLLALDAAGSAISTKGMLTLQSFLAPLANIPGFDITPFNKFDYKGWTGSFTVKNGRFFTDDWKINSSRGAWDIKGSFGFDGTLDYAVRVVVPPAVQAQMQSLANYKQAFDLMRDASGNLTLQIHVTGTAKHPSATFDLTQAKAKMQQKLMEGLRNKASDYLKRK
jgi:hypothetical protein